MIGKGRGGRHRANLSLEEEEKLLLVKTSARLFERVRQTIRELHSYEVPEVLAIEIQDGDKDYLRWLGESLEA